MKVPVVSQHASAVGLLRGQEVRRTCRGWALRMDSALMLAACQGLATAPHPSTRVPAAINRPA